MEAETHAETHAEMEAETYAEMEAETRMEAKIDRSRVRREGPPFEVLRAVVAQFNADQLLTESPQVSALVQNGLIERAKNFNIVLDDVAITHLSYGVEFSRTVEQKQEAERSKFVVAKAEQERRATIIRAEGESESAKMISEATEKAGTGLIELRKIEAMRENAATLAKSPNVAYLPGDQQILSSYAPNRRPFL